MKYGRLFCLKTQNGHKNSTRMQEKWTNFHKNRQNLITKSNKKRLNVQVKSFFF